jgi:hypothetical protein
MSGPMNRSVTFKRLEYDREYRWRLVRHPKAVGLVHEQASMFSGVALDAVGDYLDCPRRIVEETRDG